MSNFVHIHLHSFYSQLDGLNSPEAIVKTAVEHGSPAIAITDHRNTNGHIKFYQECQKYGIKPLLGVEINETDDMTIKSRKERKDLGYDDYHLVLLPVNNEGYRDLLKVVTIAATEGYFDKTEQITATRLEQYGKNLISTSACLGGRIPKLLVADRYKDACYWAAYFKSIFHKFYLEVQPNGTPEQDLVNHNLIQMSRELHIPLVVGCDAHYLKPEHAKAHEAFLCIQTGSNLEDPNRFRFPGGPVYYIWSPEEIEHWVIKNKIPYEALENTLVIADTCNVTLDLGTFKLPNFPLPNGVSQEEYLRQWAYQELDLKFGGLPKYEEYLTRADYELNIICQKGYAGYFLILADIMQFCRNNGILYGPGRGSAAGCLISYLIRITKVDPIKHNLLFERFLNPDRPSAPDIDIDISDVRREEVIEYVRQKYGHVALIATYSKLHVKSSARDLGRVLGLPFKEVDILSSLVPQKMPDQSDVNLEKYILVKNNYDEAVYKWGKTKADKLLNQINMFMEIIGKYPDFWYYLENIEGAVRAVGNHAAGVIIAPGPITNWASLVTSNKTVCSLDMNDVDTIGLLKVDLLGLKTISVVDEIAKEVNIDVDKIPLDDEATLKIYQEGKTHGVFQVAGDGITRYTRMVKPYTFDDLVDILALYRPGPLDATTETGRTIADQYIYNREHPDEIAYIHPDLKEIYAPTYGVLIYQEQVMQICQKLAGYSLAQADSFRKVIGKKKIDEVEGLRQSFVKGGVQNGYPEELMTTLFEQIKKFAGYAFNKSHSCSYALLSYITAYLKAHYPAEFMVHLLTSEADDATKTLVNIQECRRLGIPILPVDVNASKVNFILEQQDDKKAIRYAFSAIKGVGQIASEIVVNNAPYESLEDFVIRIDGRKVNKKVAKLLIKAGCFDRFEKNRLKLVNQYLFDIRKLKEDDKNIREDESAWSDEMKSTLERDLFGFYLSFHPASTLPTSCWITQAYNKPFILSGLITGIREFKDKNKKQMAIITLDTMNGQIAVYFFHKQWERMRKSVMKAFSKPPELLSLTVKKRKFNGLSIEAIKIHQIHEVLEEQKRKEEFAFVTPVRSHPFIGPMPFYS